MKKRNSENFIKKIKAGLVIAGFIAIVTIVVLIFTTATVSQPEIATTDNIMVIDQGWYCYDRGDEVPFNNFGKTITDRKLTIYHDLSFYSETINSLSLANCYSAISVYLDDELIYNYGSIDILEKGGFIGNYISIFSIPNDIHEHSVLKIVYENTENQSIGYISCGSASALTHQEMMSNLPTFVLVIFSVIALCALVFLSFNSKTKTKLSQMHFWLAVFTIVSALSQLFNSQLLQYIDVPAGYVSLLSFEAYLMIPMALLMYMYYVCDCFKRGTFVILGMVIADWIVLNILHFTGISNFIANAFFSHVATSLSLAFIIMKVFTEFFNKDSMSTRFNMVSTLILGISGIVQFLHLANNKADGYSNYLSIGLIIFIVMQVINTLQEVNNQIKKQELASQKTIEIMNKKLKQRNELLYKSFGQFLPNEMIHEMISTNQQAKLGGSKENVTVMVTDLRGFSQIVETSEPGRLIEMLNNYLSEMVKIITKWGGTVIEYLGDGILAVFGAPIQIEDHADNAVCAAVEMQNYMRYINSWNKHHGYRKVEMGIGINSGETFVGYIGSEDRLEFDIIGASVNLASRIESYSVGGQILISENSLKQLTVKVEIRDEQTVLPKGSREPVKFYQIGSIGDPFNLKLLLHDREPVPFAKEKKVIFKVVDEKHVGVYTHEGIAFAGSETNLLIRSDVLLEKYDNINIDYDGVLLGKVIDIQNGYMNIRFTSTPDGFTGF